MRHVSPIPAVCPLFEPTSPRSPRFVLPGPRRETKHGITLYTIYIMYLRQYECFLTSCTRKFATPQTRRLHLIDKHQFPKDYPFQVILGYSKKQLPCPLKKLHGKNSVSQAPAVADMEIDQITESLSNLNIPKHIGFGHKRSGKQPWSSKHVAKTFQSNIPAAPLQKHELEMQKRIQKKVTRMDIESDS